MFVYIFMHKDKYDIPRTGIKDTVVWELCCLFPVRAFFLLDWY